METCDSTILTEKSSRHFNCTYCDYLTSRISNYNKHLLTAKHLKRSLKSIGHKSSRNNIKVAGINTASNKYPSSDKKNSIIRDMCSKKSSTKPVYNCNWCNKYYKSRSGCYKHEGRCNNKITELEQKLVDLEKEMNNKKIETQNNTINNNINNNITIQLFLNENCKNAIPIESFVKNIQITMDDLFNSNRIGYVNGLSSLIVKNLQELEFTKRPIHCSDPAGFKFYIKSEKEWKKDNGDIVGKAVENVKKEANGTISKYMHLHNQNENENEQLEVMQILQTLNKFPSSIVERNQIIKNIGDSVILDKNFN